MKISISSEAFTSFNPEFKVGLLLVTGIDNTTKLPDSLRVLRDVETVIHLTFNKDTVKTHHLISPWNIIQQKLIKGVKHHHTSVEQLLTKVLARRNIHQKDTLSNLISYVSLRHIVPLSADDTARIHGDLTFTISQGGKVKKGDLYYHDTKMVLGTKLDHWKNLKTVTSTKTTSALIHIEAIPPVSTQDLKKVMAELENLIIAFCGGKVKKIILDRKKRSVTFSP